VTRNRYAVWIAVFEWFQATDRGQADTSGTDQASPTMERPGLLVLPDYTMRGSLLLMALHR
jgi:hypothetical protein